MTTGNKPGGSNEQQVLAAEAKLNKGARASCPQINLVGLIFRHGAAPGSVSLGAVV